LVTLVRAGAGGFTRTMPVMAGGYYQFMGLPAGNYTVSVAPPVGYKPTLRFQGCTLPTDPGCALDSNGDTAAMASVTLPTNNSTDLSIDFGFQAIGQIGDFVWND